MSIRRTIEVWRDEMPFERLPGDIRRALSASEAAAYREGPAYFLRRASACRYRPLKSFFRLLGRSSFRLHLYGTRSPKYRVYFGFNLLSAGRYVQVRLAPGIALPGEPPAGLAQVYDEIGGIIDGQEYVGGWDAPEDVQSVSRHGWQPTEAGGLAVEQSYPIYSFGNGDSAGYCGKRCSFLYSHDESRLESWDLMDYASRYFGDYAQTFKT